MTLVQKNIPYLYEYFKKLGRHISYHLKVQGLHLVLFLLLRLDLCQLVQISLLKKIFKGEDSLLSYLLRENN